MKNGKTEVVDILKWENGLEMENVIIMENNAANCDVKPCNFIRKLILKLKIANLYMFNMNLNLISNRRRYGFISFLSTCQSHLKTCFIHNCILPSHVQFEKFKMLKELSIVGSLSQDSEIYRFPQNLETFLHVDMHLKNKSFTAKTDELVIIYSGCCKKLRHLKLNDKDTNYLLEHPRIGSLNILSCKGVLSTLANPNIDDKRCPSCIQGEQTKWFQNLIEIDCSYFDLSPCVQMKNDNGTEIFLINLSEFRRLKKLRLSKVEKKDNLKSYYQVITTKSN